MVKSKSGLLFKWLYTERSVISRIYLLALLQGVMYLAIPLGIQGVVTYIMAGSFSASLILLSSVTILATCFIGFFKYGKCELMKPCIKKFSDKLCHVLVDILIQTLIRMKY